MPTIAWIILGIIIPALLALIGKLEGKLMFGGAIASAMLGIASYAHKFGVGILGKLPAHVWESALLWVFDELDDFKDGFSRLGWIKDDDEGGSFELIVVPLLLGFFSALMGVEDPFALVIPGNMGFAQYVADGFLGEPWASIVKIIYSIAASVIGGVIASGSAGLGFAAYVVGSVIGQVFLNKIFSQVFMFL